MNTSEEGFTLIETLITVVILGVIIGAIANAVILGINTTTTTSDRLWESRDAQIASAYFVNDVQSAGEVCTGSDCLSVTVCKSSGTALGGSDPIVISFKSTDTVLTAGVPTDTVNTVTYVTQTVSPENRLLRMNCTGTSFTEAITIAHSLDPGAGPMATQPDSKTVLLTVSDCALDSTGACKSNTAYVYQLKGTRRSA